MDYVVYAQGNDAKSDAEMIVIDVQIERDGIEIAGWVSKFSSAVADAQIRDELIRRIPQFIDIDSGMIQGEVSDIRAGAIADSIDGHLESRS